MIDGFWLSTFILMAMTLGVIYFRYSARSLESNWPLVYYTFTVLHLLLYPEGLNQIAVFTAVVMAMTLRFEFLAGWMCNIVQMIEYFCLVYVAYRLFNIVFI